MIGYTLKIHRLNEEANEDLLGVQLGRFCIANDIPVSDVMEYFKVSKQTVYNWYAGINDPKGDNRDAIRKYLNKLS